MKMLIVLLCLFLAVSAKPQEQVHSYDLYIEERGTQLKQPIKVNLEANTVFYDVPQHNDIRASHFLMDYNQNQSMRFDPVSEQCFLSDLDSVYITMTPANILEGLQVAYGKPASGVVRTFKTEWSVGEVLSSAETAQLPEDMQRMCLNYPVNRMQQIKPKVAVGTTQGLAHDRERRQAIQRTTCTNSKQGTVCFHDLTCSYTIKTSCSKEQLDQMDNNGLCINANTYHHFQRSVHCINCCGDPLQADTIFPNCASITKENQMNYRAIIG